MEVECTSIEQTFHSAVLDYAKSIRSLSNRLFKKPINGLSANERQTICLPLCGTIVVIAYSEELKALFGILQY